MIHLEDDVKTGGVRISFVVTDNEECSGDCCGLCDAGETVGDLLVTPQTVETLNIVGRLLNKARRQADDDERLWDGSRRRAEIYRILKQRSLELQ